MKKKIALIARERSGSTALQRILTGPNGFDGLGEPFNYGVLGPYYKFWREKLISDITHLSPNNKRWVFDEYIEEKTQASKKGVLFDIKYGNLDQLAGSFHPGFLANGRSFVRTPSVLKYLFESSAFIIHLSRKNKLRVFVSLQKARKTGVWRLSEWSDASTIQKTEGLISVNPEEALSFVEYDLAMSDFVDKALKHYSRQISICYEDFFNDGKVVPRQLATLLTFLGETTNESCPQLSLIRTNPAPLSETVENFDALCEVFDKSPHAWMLAM